MRELVRDLHRFTGWRIALCVRRGHADLNFSIPQFNLFGSTADLKEQLDFIRLKLPNQICMLLDHRLDRVYWCVTWVKLQISHVLKPHLHFVRVTTLKRVLIKFIRFIVDIWQKIINRFVKKHLQGWSHIDNLKELLTSKNLTEFHLRYYQLAGYTNYQDYTLATNPMHVLSKSKCH